MRREVGRRARSDEQLVPDRRTGQLRGGACGDRATRVARRSVAGQGDGRAIVVRGEAVVRHRGGLDRHDISRVRTFGTRDDALVGLRITGRAEYVQAAVLDVDPSLREIGQVVEARSQPLSQVRRRTRSDRVPVADLGIGQSLAGIRFERVPRGHVRRKTAQDQALAVIVGARAVGLHGRWCDLRQRQGGPAGEFAAGTFQRVLVIGARTGRATHGERAVAKGHLALRERGQESRGPADLGAEAFGCAGGDGQFVDHVRIGQHPFDRAHDALACLYAGGRAGQASAALPERDGRFVGRDDRRPYVGARKARAATQFRGQHAHRRFEVRSGLGLARSGHGAVGKRERTAGKAWQGLKNEV